MKQLLFIALLACVVLAAAPKWTHLAKYTFEQYIHDFQKAYTSNTEEFLMREKLFLKKLASVLIFNSQNHSYKKGINQFSDYTVQELKERTHGYSKTMKAAMSKSNAFRQLTTKVTDQQVANLPKSVDWRDQGVVSPVKDQGHCGSCWAFATVEATESLAAINSGHLKTLSTQQLVSCVENAYQCGGSGGCDGAVSELAFNYLQIFGLTSEYKYAYNSYQGDSLDCSFNPKQQPIEVTSSGYMKLPENDYNALLYAVATVGPIVISVDASDFHDYESGVFTGCTDSTNVDINHAVVLVGYGTDEVNGDYWLVRNSWGTRYGENGYIRVKRDSVPTCYKDTTPLDGNGCVGFATTMKVCGQCGILSDSAYPLDVEVVG